jgi:hypothetical protein
MEVNADALGGNAVNSPCPVNKLALMREFVRIVFNRRRCCLKNLLIMSVATVFISFALFSARLGLGPVSTTVVEVGQQREESTRGTIVISPSPACLNTAIGLAEKQHASLPSTSSSDDDSDGPADHCACMFSSRACPTSVNVGYDQAFWEYLLPDDVPAARVSLSIVATALLVLYILIIAKNALHRDMCCIDQDRASKAVFTYRQVV